MKTPLRVFLVLAVGFFFSGCGREFIDEFDDNYNGTWYSTESIVSSGGLAQEMYMKVDGEYGEYGWLCVKNCLECGCGLWSAGKAKVNKDHTKLIFGLGNGQNFTAKTINEAPHLNADGQWECTIDGYRMLRR